MRTCMNPATRGSTAIRCLRYEHNGILPGLAIDDGHGADWAGLYPDRLGFRSPWDGNYERYGVVSPPRYGTGCQVSGQAP
jgi:hypothetical protein